MAIFIALLRAINVGQRTMTMKALRDIGQDLGLGDVRTLAASGNLVFSSDDACEAVAARLETAIARTHGFTTDAIVRAAAQWPALMASNPFPEESAHAPNRVMILLSKTAQAEGAADMLRTRAQRGESVIAVDGAVWLYFAEGVAASKISPAFIDKSCGSPTTARNARTIAKLAEMTGG